MPETLGIGVDLCAVSRIERAIQKAHFLNRVFTEAERAYLQGRGKGAGESAAAMFAAKEAVAKALGTGFAHARGQRAARRAADRRGAGAP